MAHQPVCLVCKKDMDPGFLTDFGHLNSIYLPRWCAGEPEANFWSGEANRSQVNQGLNVSAYRCPECQPLRLYAFDL